MHTILPHLLRRTVKVAVVGCGGTGSALVSGLPHLHQALLAYGHPSGFSVTVMDGAAEVTAWPSMVASMVLVPAAVPVKLAV